MFRKLADRLQSASLIVIVPAALLVAAFLGIAIHTTSTGNWEGGAWALVFLYLGGGAVLVLSLIGALAFLVRTFKK